MDSFYLAAQFDLTLAELGQELVRRGVTVEPREDITGGEYLLCRTSEEPAWEISKEEIQPTGVMDLEEIDVEHIRQLGFPSLFLISFRRLAFPGVKKGLVSVPQLAGSRVIDGDSSGTSYPIKEYRNQESP